MLSILSAGMLLPTDRNTGLLKISGENLGEITVSDILPLVLKNYLLISTAWHLFLILKLIERKLKNKTELTNNNKVEMMIVFKKPT